MHKACQSGPLPRLVGIGHGNHGIEQQLRAVVAQFAQHILTANVARAAPAIDEMQLAPLERA